MAESASTNQNDQASSSGLGALEALQRVLQGIAMYGPDHPAVHAALHDCAVGCKQSQGVRVQARGVQLYSGEVCLSSDPAFEIVCAKMSNLRIAALVMNDRVTIRDIQTLVEIWNAIALDRRWSLKDGVDLRQRTSGSIEAMATSYHGIAVLEGVATGAAIDIDWSSVSADLLRVAHGTGGVTAAELAATINSDLEAQVWGLPPQVLESAAEALEHASPHDRVAAEARLTLFFNSLTGNIRETTARIDTARPSRSLKALESLSGPLPIATILSSVEQVDDPQMLATADGVRLLARLAWLSRDQDKLRSRIENVIARLRPLLAEPRVQVENIASALELLHDVVASKDCNRDAYESVLSSLARAANPTARSSVVFDGWTAQSAQVHAAVIALELALDSQTPCDTLESTFEFIERSFPALLEAQEFGLLVEAACALAAAHERDLPAGAAQAVVRCEAALCSPVTARNIASLGQQKGIEPCEVSGIFARCGGEAAAALIQAVLACDIPINPAHIINHPALNLREFAAGLLKCDVQTIKTVARLDEVAVDRRGRLAHAMLLHDNAEFRLIAYHMFHELYTQWPPSLVAHALLEEDPEICQMGIDRLDSDAANQRTAATMLAGAMNFEPSSQLFDSGISALEKHGGIAALSELRSRLLKRPSPTRLFRASKAFQACRRAARIAA